MRPFLREQADFLNRGTQLSANSLSSFFLYPFLLEKGEGSNVSTFNNTPRFGKRALLSPLFSYLYKFYFLTN